jgi:flagellar hook-associated protein 2
VSLAWKGGTLKAFAEALTTKGSAVLAASVVNDTANTQVLLIEGKLTGGANRLTFLNAAIDLGVKSGMLQRSSTASRSIELTGKTPAAWTVPLSADAFSAQNGVLVVNPGGELKLPVSPAIPLNKNMVLEFSVKVEKLPEQTAVQVKPPPGPSIPATGGMDYKGIHIENDPSETPLPEWKAPEPPANITDMNALFIEGDEGVVSLPELPDSAEFQTIQVPIGDLSSTISAIGIRNRNTYRKLDIKDVTIFDRTQRGDYVPAHALTEAGDAQISMDDIDVKRGSNTVSDLLPGVTLTLKKAGASPVTLTVSHDVENIKKQVMTLVGSYDLIITDIDILTRKDETVIADATYLSDEEKAKAKKNLGLLMGDIALQQLKSSMQQIMMNPYPTSLGSSLSLLAQVGISTDARAFGSGIEKTKLRGYLDVDEEKLTAAVDRDPEALKELFGSDTTGDLVVDSGAAYKLDELLRPYVQTGGILSQRASTLDTQIASSKKEIASYKEKLVDYEADLKQKYARMQSSLDTMNKSSQSMQNMNKSSSQ